MQAEIIGLLWACVVFVNCERKKAFDLKLRESLYVKEACIKSSDAILI